MPDKATTRNHPNRCCITRKNTKKEQLCRSDEAELIMVEKLFDILTNAKVGLSFISFILLKPGFASDGCLHAHKSHHTGRYDTMRESLNEL